MPGTWEPPAFSSSAVGVSSDGKQARIYRDGRLIGEFYDERLDDVGRQLLEAHQVAALVVELADQATVPIEHAARQQGAVVRQGGQIRQITEKQDVERDPARDSRDHGESAESEQDARGARTKGHRVTLLGATGP